MSARRPLLLPAFAALAGLALGEQLPAPSCVLLASLGALLLPGLLRRPACRVGVALAAGALTASGAASPPADDVRLLPERYEERPVLLRGRVHGLPRRTQGAGGAGVVVDLRAESLRVGRIELPLRGELRLLAEAEAEPVLARAGLIEAWVVLRRPRDPRNFNRPARPRSRLLARATARELIVVRDLRRGALDRFRLRVAEGIDAATAEPGLARALVLGARDQLDRSLVERLRAGGTAHVLAVSGLHLALVSWGAGRVAQGLGLRSRWAAALSLAVAWSFALLSGLGLPVLRAALLVTCWQAGRLLARSVDPWNAYAAALLLSSLARPEDCFGAGWWLTYTATAALLLLTRPLEDLLPAARRPVTAKLRSGLAASLGAWLGLLPVQLHWFAAVNPLAPLLNLLVVPLAGLATATALIASTLAAVAPALARPGFALLDELQQLLAGVDASAAVTGGVTGLFAAAAWAGGLAAWALLRDPRLRLLALLAAAGSGCFQLRGPSSWPEGLDARLTVLDVGQGSSALIELPRGDGGAWRCLVDGGGRAGSPRDLGRDLLVPALRALGLRRLDLVLLSHADFDHRGGLPAVVEAFDPPFVLVAPTDPLDGRKLEAVRAKARRFGYAAAGSSHGAGRLRVLWPPRSPDLRAGLAGNDLSLVLQLGSFALLPGDLEAAGESALLGRETELASTVLLSPHHGSKTSSTPAFLAAVGARVTAVSAGHRNRFGHPDAAVLARSAAPLVTARQGALRFDLRGSLCELRCAGSAAGGVLALVGPEGACQDPRP